MEYVCSSVTIYLICLVDGVACVVSSIFPVFIPKYSFIMSLTTSAVLLPCLPFSTNTTTAISGLSYGAKPTNQAFVYDVPVCADPVFPCYFYVEISEG